MYVEYVLCNNRAKSYPPTILRYECKVYMQQAGVKKIETPSLSDTCTTLEYALLENVLLGNDYTKNFFFCCTSYRTRILVFSSSNILGRAFQTGLIQSVKMMCGSTPIMVCIYKGCRFHCFKVSIS